MVNINTNYDTYVKFYNKHKEEIEKTGTIEADKMLSLKLIFNKFSTL